MVNFDETKLPGVGVRHDFLTEDGRRVGVITHLSGRKELLVYSSDDPDACSEVVSLEANESAGLTELLGGSQVHATLDELQQDVEGLAIDWLHVTDSWWCAGRTITETHLRRRTGVSIVAVIAGEKTVPSPEPNEPLAADSTLVVVGTPEGITRAIDLLRDGP
ncbi:cation:proton antiporter regulatory subunit [Euzebya tangerina]|uniref:cation:proton antiporter regulatory subunit n=1 Tax=Euzebya tangerina TaxID=591198 RepID=UPI000E30F1AA|nr:cation:proton antiporter regulatory subunit [Euzebya tangerina]